MEKLIEAVKLSEGFRDKVYKDTLGIDTIGYGFAIKDLVLEEDICDIILDRKLKDLISKVDKKFPFVKGLPEKGREVVYEMCYQLGVNGFSKFKRTISYLQLGDYSSASREMLESKWHRQTPNRSQRLSDIIYSLEG